jgi:hypothetical protein
MTNTPVAAQVHQALDIHRHFAAKVTLDSELADLFPQPIHFGLREVFDLSRAGYPGSVTDLL